MNLPLELVHPAYNHREVDSLSASGQRYSSDE